MKITSIKRQSNRPDRYSVYVDEAFAFGVSESQLLELGIVKGQELTQAEYEQLQNEATLGKAYDRALRYIGIRPRSQKEIHDYLKRKQCERTVVDNVIELLQQKDLLDDERFARDWVSWRQATSPRSRKRLWAELRQKGVDQEYIETALEDIHEDTEVKQAAELILKRGPRYDSREKLMAYLARQGYSYDIIRQAFAQIEEQ